MADDIPFARSDEMETRWALAAEFYEATGPEVVPFVSDEASWFDFDYMATDDLARAVQAHYGFALDETKLGVPFWMFLDYLDTSRRR